MAEIDILIEDDRWEALGLPALAGTACAAALTIAGVEAGEISLLAADDTRIADLNAEFRGKPTPTNVLSWPFLDLAPDTPGTPPAPPVAELGDIAIAWETCAREAEAGGLPMSDHVTHLLIHATLHLLGYDHQNDADATLMEGLEVKALENLGLHNPY